MIRIGILGDIGSGKTYVTKKFGYPVFNADNEVGKLYKNNKKVFQKLKKILPKYFHNFPISKIEVAKAILANKNNLNKIIKVVHLEIRKSLNIFLKKNKKKRIVVLDVPLLLENKLNKKDDILIFVKSKRTQILKRLKRRKNFNARLLKIFRNIQLSLEYKQKKSNFIIKNDFSQKSVKKEINTILKKIYLWKK